MITSINHNGKRRIEASGQNNPISIDFHEKGKNQ
jgi:hypothetical protein